GEAVRAGPGGGIARSVGAAGVGDDHLTADAERVDRGEGLAHAVADGLRLVEARHEDGELDLVAQRDHHPVRRRRNSSPPIASARPSAPATSRAGFEGLDRYSAVTDCF